MLRSIFRDDAITPIAPIFRRAEVQLDVPCVKRPLEYRDADSNEVPSLLKLQPLEAPQVMI